MNFPSPVSIGWIANLIDARIIGDPEIKATGLNEIHKVRKGDIVFVDHSKYYDTCLNSDADFIIINSEKINNPKNKTLLIHSNPFEGYLKIVDYFRPFTPTKNMISPSAVIGKSSVIMPGVFIGEQVKIGEDTIIYPNVTILDYTEIGDHVVIQSGTVIGSNAFYYNGKNDREVKYKRMKSCGSVIIEDHVEIGANCTIDKGVSSPTRIGKGTIIDNLVHIGHDTIIGRNCLFAAQVGIAGATTIENNVCLWGQVGVNKTLTIGENAEVLAQSGVPSSIKGNTTYFGSPVEDVREKRRELVWIKRIPELWKNVMEKK